MRQYGVLRDLHQLHWDADSAGDQAIAPFSIRRPPAADSDGRPPRSHLARWIWRGPVRWNSDMVPRGTRHAPG